MDKQKFLGRQRQRRRFHTRKRIRGTADRPRMSVNRSNRNIEVQVIDDFEGKTLVSVSSRDGETGSGISYGGIRIWLNLFWKNEIGPVARMFILDEMSLSSGTSFCRMIKKQGRKIGQVWPAAIEE